MRRPGLLAAAALAALALGVLRAGADPESPLLLPRAGARWVRLDEPPNLVAREDSPATARFRKRFTLADPVPEAVLEFSAVRLGNVWLDGKLAFAPPPEPKAWKTPRKVPLGSLPAGEHELRLAVENRHGPPLLWARSEALGVASGPDWEASRDGRNWAPAADIVAVRPAEISLRFPSPPRALASLFPLLAPLFLIVFAAMKRGARNPSRLPAPALARAALWAAWIALAFNNLPALPALVGYDVPGHLDYIVYVAKTGRIPLADMSWESFQAPFFYMLCAPLYLALRLFASPERSELLLRVVPWACGMAQIEIAYRSMAEVFPRRPDLHAVGTVVAGLMPMNLYLSQTVSNEPLAGCLSAAAVGMGFALCRNLAEDRPTSPILLPLGLTLGLALLTKVSAWLLVPPLAGIAVYAARRPRDRRRVARGAGAVAGLALLVCGWFYLRNWILLGKPFILGGDLETGRAWWQDPGYRTFGHFFSFGAALAHPVYSGLNSVWDALYSTLWLDGFLSGVAAYPARPPWNYSAMTAGAWLALLPTAGILLGAERAFSRPSSAFRDGTLLAAGSLGIYLAMILYVCLKLPIYSTAKATYTIGLLPCYGALAASGLDRLMTGRISRALTCAGLACWAACAYGAYFIIRP